MKTSTLHEVVKIPVNISLPQFPHPHRFLRSQAVSRRHSPPFSFTPASASPPFQEPYTITTATSSNRFPSSSSSSFRFLLSPCHTPSMATATATAVNAKPVPSIGTRTPRVCFSVAAYAKNVIRHLADCDVPIQEGLSDDEFSSIEASLGFTFPPDLRSILREGLPVGPGFPNWRSSSYQQLEILINLPILELCKEVSMGNFWCESWGDEPVDSGEALALARRFLKEAPALVPIYSHCYIPSKPNLAGNPVFFVHGGNVRMWSLDMAGFFEKGKFFRPERGVCPPAWAATTARRIDFWTEAVERARGGTRGWWSGELGRCMEEMFWRLRDGGWREEEVREMMMMDGCDENDKETVVSREKEGVAWYVQVMSMEMLRAGWSTEDVVESLGHQIQHTPTDGGDSWLDFQPPDSCSQEG